MDIIDSKLYKSKPKIDKKIPKYRCSVKFDNKIVELVRLSKIIRHPDVVASLPLDLQVKDNIPVVTYTLCEPIRNKILNYQETVDSIYVDDEVSFSLNTQSCDCQNSNFCDPHHKHIITGDLRIIENAKLRKLLTKGPNYREPRPLNFSRAVNNIQAAVENCMENFSLKTKHPANTFINWKEKVMEKVNERIKYLTSKFEGNNTRASLCDPEVKSYLETLHKKFVIVTIDKASNNFAFICKKFYISKLLSELGELGAPKNKTYSKTDISKEKLINNNIDYCKKFGLDVIDKQKGLPRMYWLPKMHKTPIGARYIVASKHCSNKPLAKVVSKVFKMIFNHVESFHKKSFFYSSCKKFWVVQNSFPIIEKLNKINAKKNAKNISTFDFSTLYTSIPHKLLIRVLNEIVKFVFTSKRSKSRIGFSNSSVYWTSKGVQKRYFTKTTLINAVSFLISQCYFTVGNLVFKQDIGIPMGIDPAPFWANLFLYFFESKFIKNLLSSGSKRAYKYHGIGRFIDDLCALNDGNDFAKSHRNIYPKELELKIEHQGTHATFLDLDITIINKTFVYKLFDKRDAFPFFIVRMPHLCSNIPSSIFYGSVFSEFLRIARCSLLFHDFQDKASSLFQRMISQGGKHNCLINQLRKAFERYPNTFAKFNKQCKDICDSITS